MLPEKFSQVTASTTFGNPLSVINLHFQHLFCKLQVVECNLNPKWKPHDISVTRLCGGNEDQKILVSKIVAFDWLTEVRWTSYLLTPLPQKLTSPQLSCYDHDDDGSHDFIGYFTTTIRELRESQV